jgi:sodium transport system permease protein
VAVFSGGMAVAIDATAGERERRSLEALLVNPAPRLAVVVGKWLATAVAAAGAVTLTAVLCMLLPQVLPLQEMGIRFRFGPDRSLGVLAALLPLCLLLSSLQIWVATFARSTKEAQSYLGFLMILPMMPAVMMSVAPLGGQIWTYGVPMLGSQVLLAEVFGGRTPAAWAFATSAAVSLAAAGALVGATARLFGDERIVFGR